MDPDWTEPEPAAFVSYIALMPRSSKLDLQQMFSSAAFSTLYRNVE